MKRDAPFYIGSVNIYDYQKHGFYRWNTFQAAQNVAIRFAFEAPFRPSLSPMCHWPFPTGGKS